MRIFLRVSGGIANVRLEGVVESDDLPPDLAAQVARTLSPEALRAAGAESGSPAPDARTFEVHVESAGDSAEARFGEATASPEVLAALNAVLRRITDERRAQGGGGAGPGPVTR